MNTCNVWLLPALMIQNTCMKYYLLHVWMIGLILGFASCKKDSQSVDKNIPSYLKGTWELRKRISSIPTINYPEGNGNKLEFTGTSYKRYTDGQLAKTGTYTIVADGSVTQSVCLVIGDGQFKNRIIFDGENTGTKIFLNVTGDQLEFISGCFAVDAGSSVLYARVKTP